MASVNSNSCTLHNTSSSGARISILDDDPYYLHLYTVILQGAGHQVTTIQSAEDFEWSTISSIELLILDMMMPGTDGLAFMESVKRERPDINILLATSLKMHEVSELLDSLAELEMQIRGIVYKPFIAEDLASVIDRSLDQLQILPYTRHSLELLDQAIRRDEFVINYKPHHCIDTHDTALIQVDPYLLASEGAMPEEDYTFIIFNSGLSTLYLKYLIDKVIIESAYIPDSRKYPFMIKVPMFLLSHPDIRDLLLSSLTRTKSMGVEIVIAVDDSEYFLSGDISRAPIREMKLQGCRMVLHNARYSLHSNTLSMLSVFDFVHLGPGYNSPNNNDLQRIQPNLRSWSRSGTWAESGSDRRTQMVTDLPLIQAGPIVGKTASPDIHRSEHTSDLNHE